MKNKPQINFVIDAFILLLIMAKGGIGLLIKCTLIPGSERWEVYESNVELYLFGLDRHQWGSIHLILGYIFFVLLFLHIVLHWRQIVNIYKKLIPDKSTRNVTTVVFVFVSLCFLFFGLFLPHEVEPLQRGEGRQSEIKAAHEETLGEQRRAVVQTTEESTSNVIQQEGLSRAEVPESEILHEEEEHSEHSVQRVYGYMTLGAVVRQYNLSTDSLKKFLNIPLATSDNEQLGRLRRLYSFHMSDVERFIDRSIKKEK